MNTLLKSLNLQLKYFINITSSCSHTSIRSFFLSKSSYLNKQFSLVKFFFIKNFTGNKLNRFKGSLVHAINLLSSSVKTLFLQEEVSFDPSVSVGSFYPTLHPISKIIFSLVSFLKKLGFTFTFGYELETVTNCFSLLNMAPCHEARSSKNTFYLQDKTKGEVTLLRTQTSTIQIKAMLGQKPPIRRMSFGRVFRNDNVDLTHNVNFYQLEGLYVDTLDNISVVELKNVLTSLLKNILGRSVIFRFRNSYFPFTIPSFEVDVFDTKLNVWVEVLGCGLVHPKIIRNAFGEVSAPKLSGYAFGIGIERLAMLLYPETGLKTFYNNNYRSCFKAA
ncbi:MAG: hypothetical protein QTO32_00955 [Candidatus Organicella extenuata]|uniref:phenylalanine--tRNA ligase n=1 Tax=Candidatus Organicella extenuata TaxID=2841811 RepID=A0AA51BKL4_9BACT|nr:MAG: hypothetical protein QTO32_00955 [Candidatus Organicella extenuata]